MKISSRVDYALSCVLRIADKFGSGKPVSIAYVSKREKIEPDYIEQLLVRMRHSGILKSIRGPAGGYILSRSPSRITASDVIMAIEKNILVPTCFREKGRRKKCIHLKDCRIKVLWQDLEKAMSSCLQSYTLERLLKLRKKEKYWRRNRR